MNRAILSIIAGIAVLAVAVPVLVFLFVFPLRAETRAATAGNNQVPNDLQALAVNDRLAIQLTWTPVNQGTANYVLQRSTEGEEEGWQDLVELSPGQTYYLDDDGLLDGVTYLYRIYAWDPQGGRGYSNGDSAMATAIPQAIGLTPNELESLQAELSANIEKWRRVSRSNYAIEFRVNCFCPTDIMAPVRINVRDTDKIESVLLVNTGDPVTEHLDLYLTVGGMFDMIQEAIDMKVANLTVSYDPDFGYPTNVFVDRDFLMADEEHGFESSNLEFLGQPNQVGVRSQLDGNRHLIAEEDLELATIISNQP